MLVLIIVKKIKINKVIVNVKIYDRSVEEM
jgi:hypothetical protein